MAEGGAQAATVGLILEGFVAFQRELSVVAAMRRVLEAEGAQSDRRFQRKNRL